MPIAAKGDAPAVMVNAAVAKTAAAAAVNAAIKAPFLNVMIIPVIIAQPQTSIKS